MDKRPHHRDTEESQRFTERFSVCSVIFVCSVISKKLCAPLCYLCVSVVKNLLIQSEPAVTLTNPNANEMISDE
jgi:hypothetical protein